MALQIEEELDQALDELLARDRKSPGEYLEWFPADSGVRGLLLAAEAARSLLSATPSAEVRARQIAQLMERARAFQAPQKTWQPRPASRTRAYVLRPILVLAVVAATMAAPLVAMASAAGPGDALYGTKLALEKVQLALERDPVEEVTLRLEFAKRRIGDLSELLSEGRTGEIGRAMASLNAHLGEAEDGVSELEQAGEPTVSLEEQLSEVLGKHLTVLDELIENAECDAENPEARKPQCKGLLNAHENSSKVLDKFQGASQRKAGGGRPETAGEAHGRPARQVPATGPAGEVAPPGKSGGVTSDSPGRGADK